MKKIKENDTQKLQKIISYIKSRVDCVENMNYPFQMAYHDIVHFTERVDKTPFKQK